MRWTLLLAAILGVTAALAQEQRPVIKAKDPSTVTVYGSVEKVPEDKRVVKNTESGKGFGQKVNEASARLRFLRTAAHLRSMSTSNRPLLSATPRGMAAVLKAKTASPCGLRPINPAVSAGSRSST